MNPPSVDVKNWLIDSGGLGYTFATDIFIGIEPESATDNIVTIYDTGGWSPDPHISYERPTVMIAVRNSSYTAGYAAAEAIRDLLLDQFNVTVGSVRYIAVYQEGAINHIGHDDNRRAQFTMNFVIHRTE